MMRANLEVLRAIEAIQDQGSGLLREVKGEANISERKLRYCLNSLCEEGLINRSLTQVRLTDEGRAAVKKYRGLVPFTCSRCGKEVVVEEEKARSLLGGHCPKCNGEFLREAIYLTPEGLVYPAPEGMPPTRKNLRGQVIYTFASYVDGEGRRRCGARTRRGEPCQRFAMEGSRAGRCPKHGGRALKGFEASKGKGYSKYLDTSLREKYEQLAADEDLLDLRNELVLLRSRIAEEPNMPIRSLAYTVDTLAKTAQKIVEREEGKHFYLTVAEYEGLLDQTAVIIRQVIRTCPHCGKSLDPLLEELAFAFKERHQLPRGDK